MPPASSRCKGSRVGILPSLCSTPSIQDAQSSQSSTIPAFVICNAELGFASLDGVAEGVRKVTALRSAKKTALKWPTYSKDRRKGQLPSRQHVPS